MYLQWARKNGSFSDLSWPKWHSGTPLWNIIMWRLRFQHVKLGGLQTLPSEDKAKLTRRGKAKDSFSLWLWKRLNARSPEGGQPIDTGKRDNGFFPWASERNTDPAVRPALDFWFLKLYPNKCAVIFSATKSVTVGSSSLGNQYSKYRIKDMSWDIPWRVRQWSWSISKCGWGCRKGFFATLGTAGQYK